MIVGFILGDVFFMGREELVIADRAGNANEVVEEGERFFGSFCCFVTTFLMDCVGIN